MCLDQPGPLAGLARRSGALEVVQLDAGAVGQALGRLGEGGVLRTIDEADDVAAGATSEAVEQPFGRRHRERRRLLFVERAQALEVAAAGVAKLYLLADHVGDGRALADGCDVLVPDTPCHAASVWAGHFSSRSPSRRDATYLPVCGSLPSVGVHQPGVPVLRGRVGQL